MSKDDTLDALKTKLQMVLPHLLASGRIKQEFQPFSTYLIDSDPKSGLILCPLTKEQIITELKHLTQPLIDAIDDKLFHKVRMFCHMLL